MAYKYQTINLTSQDFEQGGINGTTGENIEGTNRIRSKEIYPIDGLGYGANNTIISITAVTSLGKELNICYELYDSNNGFLKNEGWQSVPGDYTFLNTAKKTRFLIRNTDDTDISPNDMISISLTLKTSYFFVIRDGYPYISDLGNPIEIPSYPSPSDYDRVPYSKYAPFRMSCTIQECVRRFSGSHAYQSYGSLEEHPSIRESMLGVRTIHRDDLSIFRHPPTHNRQADMLWQDETYPLA